MTIEEKVIQALRRLPDLRQQQALDFIEFLQAREKIESEQPDSALPKSFGDGLAAFRQEWQIESLDIDPDLIFAGTRDHSVNGVNLPC